ncbi:hypothetical protein ACLOJK_000014 [Asimina triloba]
MKGQSFGHLWWSSETVAVVTGSNRGIGNEIVRQLAVQGLTVVIASRDTSRGQEAMTILQEEGLNVAFCQLDIVDVASIRSFAEWISKTYGGLDILFSFWEAATKCQNLLELVNNAGVNFNSGSENSVAFAEKVIATNYFGTKQMTKAMIPLMKPSACGARIVNVSSRLGRLNGRRNRLADTILRQKLSEEESLSEELIDATVSKFLEQVKDGSWTSGGWPQMFTDYSVSKLAVNAYSRLMAMRLLSCPDGNKIYINCYCPGWVKTAMTGWEGNISADEGADTGVWLALLPCQPATTGKFFAGRQETPNRCAVDPPVSHPFSGDRRTIFFSDQDPVCYVASWDEITYATQEAEGKKIDEAHMIGKWRIVIVRDLPFIDQRLNGKIPKVSLKYFFGVPALLLQFSIYNEGNAIVRKHKATPEEVEMQLTRYHCDAFSNENRFNG